MTSGRAVGVDMSTAPSRTAVATVVPRDGVLLVEKPVAPTSDDDLVRLVVGLEGDDRAGFDCPLGWPDAFVAAVTAHAARRAWPGRAEHEPTARAHLRLRHTDRQVTTLTTLNPLSVSADKLGSVAMRCAYVLDTAGVRRNAMLSRDGSGPVIEVYPRASRKCWRLSDGRDLDELAEKARLDFDTTAQQAYAGSEHAFDALVAALTVRAHQLGLTEPVPADHADAARSEGWIVLPTADSLARLAEPGQAAVRPGGAG